jgi:CRISPR type I-E-associated protein CasB/Cse2
VTATEEFVHKLTDLKSGELGQLRNLAGVGLDESLRGFDLFAGLWWPLRQKSQRAPRREVAWLVAKLYAGCPMPQVPGASLAGQLRKCRPVADPARSRFMKKVDAMLLLPVRRIEPALRWALNLVGEQDRKLDWVMLTDDLSLWQRERTKVKWANEFLGYSEREVSC